MSLQFVMGGAGSGKTRYLYETAIKQAVEQPDRLSCLLYRSSIPCRHKRNWCAFTPERA